MERASEAVRLSIEKEIAAGLLRPGQRLDETALAKRFAVSRTPAREALLQLAAAGQVRLVPRQGAVVTELTAQRALNLIEVLVLLEAEAARLAARRMTDAEREALTSAHGRAAHHAEAMNVEGYLAVNAAFHGIIYAGSKNDYLGEQLQAIRSRINSYQLSSLRQPERIAKSHAEHERILAAIMRGDDAEAHAAMHAHISRGGTVYTDTVARLSEAGVVGEKRS